KTWHPGTSRSRRSPWARTARASTKTAARTGAAPSTSCAPTAVARSRSVTPTAPPRDESAAYHPCLEGGGANPSCASSARRVLRQVFLQERHAKLSFLAQRSEAKRRPQPARPSIG